MPTGLTDMEITRACAKAMDFDFRDWGEPHHPACLSTRPRGMGTELWQHYCPLYDDAQAMALVKRFGLTIVYHVQGAYAVEQTWVVADGLGGHTDALTDLNRAICLCVAALAQEREGRG